MNIVLFSIFYAITFMHEDLFIAQLFLHICTEPAQQEQQSEEPPAATEAEPAATEAEPAVTEEEPAATEAEPEAAEAEPAAEEAQQGMILNPALTFLACSWLCFTLTVHFSLSHCKCHLVFIILLLFVHYVSRHLSACMV